MSLKKKPSKNIPKNQYLIGLKVLKRIFFKNPNQKWSTVPWKKYLQKSRIKWTTGPKKINKPQV